VSVRRRAVLRDVAQFVAVTIVLGAIFAALVIRAGHIASGRSLFTRGLMWSPGAAALLQLRRRGVSWREIGWTWTGRWEWICYGAVLCAGLVVYGLSWKAGLMVFPDRVAVESIAKDFGWQQLPTSVVVAGYATLMMTLGMLPAVSNALGEEIGWRGYLVPRLAQEYGFTTTALTSGGIWAAWHFPMFLVTDYYHGGQLWFSLASFTTLVLAASVICAWLRLKSGSIWPAVILHGANNLLVQDVMRPLTGTARMSHYAIDEFGGLLPLVAVAAAVIVWRHRGAVEGIALEREENGDAYASVQAQSRMSFGSSK
jgi:membrane protease YdiL (CAAX protease family)